ncbi:hypothetical protein ES703_36057 [subsurface metagenome]
MVTYNKPHIIAVNKNSQLSKALSKRKSLQGVAETHTVAMGATSNTLTTKTVIEMRKGDFEALYMKGTDGYLIY